MNTATTAIRDPFAKTLAMLDERQKNHEHQLRLIALARVALAANRPLEYQVHVQQSSPDNRAIMVQGKDLTELFGRVDAIQELYRDSRTGREVYVLYGGNRIAISPEDVKFMAEGLGITGCRFFLDSRVADKFLPMVFGPGDEMPSGWYASRETPFPRTVAVAADA
ncbi:MAG TPA: hypothetical protein VFT82_01880 [Candidatus Paceibacterota bacterium]|nr:hypothetical protein [Candidatus Paceibacterota bacterium]